MLLFILFIGLNILVASIFVDWETMFLNISTKIAVKELLVFVGYLLMFLCLLCITSYITVLIVGYIPDFLVDNLVDEDLYKICIRVLFVMLLSLLLFKFL